MIEPAGCETLPVVVFTIGSWRVGVEARYVRAARQAGSDQPEECISDIAWRLGIVADTAPIAPQWISLKHAEDGKGKEILIDGPVEFTEIPVDVIYPLPPLLAARSQLRGLLALALPVPPIGNKPIFLIDVEQLLAAIQ